MDKYPICGSYPRSGLHTILLTFQSDEYSGTIKRELGGNCMGAEILKSIVEDVADEGFAQEILDEYENIILTNPAGNTLIVDDPEHLSMCLVKVEIIAYEVKSDDRP